ncbi:MAG: hypothetical protein K2G89_03140 [Lachnospiraceae bacterium]|nr:hypothetical protein [Lachnospiraceae bacterium]
MKKKVHLFVVFVMMFSMIFALSGCGNKRSVTDEMADIEETGGSIGENGNERQESGESGVAALEVPNERWKETIASEGEHPVEVNISVKPEVPESGTLKIVELTPVSFDAEGRKMLMNQLCDADNIRVLDDNNLPKWYLEEEIAEYEKDISGSAGEGGSIDPAVTEILQRDKAQLDSAPEEGAAPTDYEQERYTGTIDGITYMFSFHDNDHLSFSAPSKKDEIALLGKPELTEDCHLERNFGLPEKNECSMSQEEAVLKAAGYLSNWGYSEFTLWNVKPLSFYAADTSTGGDMTWSEGYEMIFVRALDDVLVNGDPYGDSRVEAITLALTDKGIFSGSFRNLYQMNEVIAEEPRLLGFEEVKKSFASVLAKHAGADEASESISLDKMELTYFPVADHEAGYTLLPAWKLYKKNVADEIESIFIINAIDGSYIFPAKDIDIP